MDLSFSFFDRPAGIVPGPGSVGGLLLDAAARQGSSTTAMIQTGLQMAAVASVAAGPFASSDGSFNSRVAARLARWRQR